jgi:hypothetical protein
LPNWVAGAGPRNEKVVSEGLLGASMVDISDDSELTATGFTDAVPRAFKFLKMLKKRGDFRKTDQDGLLVDRLARLQAIHKCIQAFDQFRCRGSIHVSQGWKAVRRIQIRS